MYKQLGGSAITYHGLDKLTDVEISLNVSAVNIIRHWLDTSELHKNFKIAGMKRGSWSNGKLDSSNTGVLPLLTNAMIVAKDITVTASTEIQPEAIDDVCSLVSC